MAREAKFEQPGVLSVEEMEALEKQAAQEVQEELKADTAKTFLEEKKKELKKRALFRHGKNVDGKDTASIRLDLSPNSPYISLDGQVFYHGHTYTLPREKVAVLQDQMYRGWLHEAEIHGMDENAMNGRRAANLRLSGND